MNMYKVYFCNGKEMKDISVTTINEKIAIELAKDELKATYPEFQFQNYKVITLKIMQESE